MKIIVSTVALISTTLRLPSRPSFDIRPSHFVIP